MRLSFCVCSWARTAFAVRDRRVGAAGPIWAKGKAVDPAKLEDAVLASDPKVGVR
jgi:hypothetical protein